MRAERVHFGGFGVIFACPCIADSFCTIRFTQELYSFFVVASLQFLFASANISTYKQLYFSVKFLINEANVQSNCRSFLKIKLKNISRKHTGQHQRYSGRITAMEMKHFWFQTQSCGCSPVQKPIQCVPLECSGIIWELLRQ